MTIDMQRVRAEQLTRSLTIQRDGAIDEEARTVSLAFSSEEPYTRWWGTEILDHAPGSMRLARLKDGAPLLLGHRSDQQIGVIESVSIGADRVGRAVVRFSRSAKGEEVFRDVADGIMRKVSVGYVIHEMQLTSKQGDAETYRVTDWEPYEISMVSVPADNTVGVGREAGGLPLPIERITMTTQATPATPPATPSAEEQARAAVAAERERVAELMNIARDFAHIAGAADLAQRAIADTSGTQNPESVRKAILETMRGRQTATPTAQPAEQPGAAPAFGALARAGFRYTQLRAFTREVPTIDGRMLKPEEAAYRAGMWAGAVIYGNERAAQWCRENGIETRVMGGNTNTLGGVLVPIEVEQAVIDLRDEYGIARKLARVRPMASDTKEVPRRKGGVTAYFFNDEDSSGPTASDKTWDNVALNAKKLGALCRVSEDYEEDAILNVGDDLAQEMAYAFAVKEDQCLLVGDGTSTYGGMTGIVTKFETTAYKSRVTTATGHDTFPEIDASDIATWFAGVAAYAKRGTVIVSSEEFVETVFSRLKATAGGNDLTSLAGTPGYMYLGKMILTSQAMPTDFTADMTNKVMALCGRFDLAASFGARRGIGVKVLRERYAELGQIGFMATERFDINVHDLGDTNNKGPVAALYGNT